MVLEKKNNLIHDFLLFIIDTIIISHHEHIRIDKKHNKEAQQTKNDKTKRQKYHCQ